MDVALVKQESNNSTHPSRSRKEVLAELVLSVQDGDLQAFEDLVKQTEKLVRKLAYPIVGRDAVEDALQETYLSVFRHLDQLQQPLAFVGWLSRMALHVCYDLSKRAKPTESLPPNISGPDTTDSVAGAVTLVQALNRLTKAERDLLILRELIGLDYEELGYTLRIPIGTVKSRLNKARKHLKERLTPPTTSTPR